MKRFNENEYDFLKFCRSQYFYVLWKEPFFQIIKIVSLFCSPLIIQYAYFNEWLTENLFELYSILISIAYKP